MTILVQAADAISAELICLEDFKIDLPARLEKGDLVHLGIGTAYMGDVFVIKGIACDDPVRHQKDLMRADSSDMTASILYESGAKSTATAFIAGRIDNITKATPREPRGY